MRIIGVSINEAIDWTQDRLITTRPIAEAVLFSLLADRKVRETEDGFVLFEDDDEDLRRRDTRVRHDRRYHRRGHALRLKTSNVQLTNRVQHDDPSDDDDDTDHALF